MINKKKIFFDWELVEWAVICRDLYQHRWMWGPDANTDRLKQSITAVRASGGFPGNDYWVAKILIIVVITQTQFWHKRPTILGSTYPPWCHTPLGGWPSTTQNHWEQDQKSVGGCDSVEMRRPAIRSTAHSPENVCARWRRWWWVGRCRYSVRLRLKSRGIILPNEICYLSVVVGFSKFHFNGSIFILRRFRFALSDIRCTTQVVKM